MFQRFKSDDFLGNTTIFRFKSNNDEVSGIVYKMNDYDNLIIPVPDNLEPLSNTEDGHYVIDHEGKVESTIKGLLFGKADMKLSFYFYYLRHNDKLYLIIPYVENFNSIGIHYVAECGEVNLILNV